MSPVWLSYHHRDEMQNPYTLRKAPRTQQKSLPLLPHPHPHPTFDLRV